MAWTLIPCLVQLRNEFNAVAPRRDKGADGSIGDSSHTSSSDHTPDEDSNVLRDHDADSKNEVHALDIDSTGPWPEPGWFDKTIKAIVAREKAEYESPTMVGRLKYVIWNRRIAERSNGWNWRAYSGASAHTDHAHFSARYLTETENDTRPWGVQEDDVPLTENEIDKIAARAAERVWSTRITDYADKANPKRQLTAEVWLGYSDGRHITTRNLITALAGNDPVNEQEIVAGVLAGLPAERIAAAIPAELAEQVATELAQRLQA